MKVSKFQFVNPYLEEMVFNINDSYNSDDEAIEMHNSFNIKVNKNEGENIAKVTLTLEINQDDSSAPFQMRISVASDFKWGGEIEENKLDFLLNNNAPALLLGYMRPIVANITNSSRYPVYNLPFIDFKD